MDKFVDSFLRSCCHVSSGSDGDNFVGIKGDADGVKIFFPIGYHLPNNDNDLRKEIRVLLRVLYDHGKKDQGFLDDLFPQCENNQYFPLHAYMDVITNFLENNGKYYVEAEHSFVTRTHGKINWSRTIKHHLPMLQDNDSLVFDKFIVQNIEPNADKLITKIHKYCVYESFSKLGWLFLSTLPEPPDISYNKQMFLHALQKKLHSTNNDRQKKLFCAMIEIIQNTTHSSEHDFSYGTDFFERIWECMIDEAFGETNKKKFFPKAKWILKNGFEKFKSPLEPDSIMVDDEKIYVLDAKYYRFGVTKNPDHLPDSSSINKQITYGEYIYNTYNFSPSKLFNAFILPGDMMEKKDKSRPFEIVCNIGEAVGCWTKNNYPFQRIQGILFDTRYLMHHYKSIARKDRKSLIQSIESGFVSFDYGDEWEHDITVKKVVNAEPKNCHIEVQKITEKIPEQYPDWDEDGEE